METKLNIESIKSWGIDISKPLVIAGPCSAESEKQVMQTAEQLKDGKIQIFRAGIWKPRTRPNSFEGVGSEGLSWLKKVKDEFGLKVSTEVATAHHAYEALKYGIDFLWIGARTTVNPFAVQAIADALKGIDVPVLVKNPINPDPDLWLGAIERFNKAGIKRIGAIHRGFSSYSEKRFRNSPNWQIPIELKRRFPEIPMICDPSHICGKVSTLLEVSQKAMDLDFEGLMIESHYKPEVALSDAQQQLTPEALNDLLDLLVLRQSSIADNDFQSILDSLRQEIDHYDNEILGILEARMGVAERIGIHKNQNNITILQNTRWAEILEKSIQEGKEKGLSSEFILKIFNAIHQESINHQTSIMNKKEKKSPALTDG